VIREYLRGPDLMKNLFSFTSKGLCSALVFLIRQVIIKSARRTPLLDANGAINFTPE